MKTAELLQEVRYSKEVIKTRYNTWDYKTGKTVYHPNGVEVKERNFYEPGFRQTTSIGKNTPGPKHNNLGDITGTVGDWLKLMGAGPEHLSKAVELVKNSPEYEALLRLGFEDKSTEGDLKNGTLNFIGYPGRVLDKGGENPRSRVRRKVLANGNIRTHAGSDDHHAGRGSTQHPWTTKTHPKATPVERIVGTMRQSIKRLVDIHRPKFTKAALSTLRGNK